MKKLVVVGVLVMVLLSSVTSSFASLPKTIVIAPVLHNESLLFNPRWNTRSHWFYMSEKAFEEGREILSLIIFRMFWEQLEPEFRVIPQEVSLEEEFPKEYFLVRTEVGWEKDIFGLKFFSRVTLIEMPENKIVFRLTGTGPWFDGVLLQNQAVISSFLKIKEEIK